MTAFRLPPSPSVHRTCTGRPRVPSPVSLLAVSYTHGTGTADIVCPPATQFAVYNNLACEKRREFFEGFGHEEIQDFDDLIIPFFCEGGEAHV